MAQIKIKVGDTVKCINPYGGMTMGGLYVVSRVYDEDQFDEVMVLVEGVSGFRRLSRFVLVDTRPVQGDDDDDCI